jgi:UDP-glucuronate decarboxylase
MRPDDGRVVSTFIVQALRQQPLTVFGDGTQTRSFCYVDDMVEALIRLMDTPSEVTGPINLGNPHEFTMLELAQKVIELVGDGAIEHRPRPADDPIQRRPDIAQAQELLDWKPAIDLDEGLARTVEYFRELLDTRGRSDKLA